MLTQKCINYKRFLWEISFPIDYGTMVHHSSIWRFMMYIFPITFTFISSIHRTYFTTYLFLEKTINLHFCEKVLIKVLYILWISSYIPFELIFFLYFHKLLKLLKTIVFLWLPLTRSYDRHIKMIRPHNKWRQ